MAAGQLHGRSLRSVDSMVHPTKVVPQLPSSGAGASVAPTRITTSATATAAVVVLATCRDRIGGGHLPTLWRTGGRQAERSDREYDFADDAE